MSILEKAYFKLYKCVETCCGGHSPDAIHSLLLSLPMGLGFRVVGQRPYVNRFGPVKDIEIQLQQCNSACFFSWSIGQLSLSGVHGKYLVCKEPSVYFEKLKSCL